MWTVASQIRILLSKSCIVYFYIMLAFLLNWINAHEWKRFHANETKNTCFINTKIVLDHFLAKGVSPHLLLFPPKLRPASHQVAWTDFHLELLSNQVIRQQNATLLDWAHSGKFLTVKQKAKNKARLVSRLLSMECYQLLLSTANFYQYTIHFQLCFPESVDLNAVMWKDHPSAELFRIIKRLM